VDLGDGRAAAVAGVFFLSASEDATLHSGYLRIIPHLVESVHELAVGDCAGHQRQLSMLSAGMVGINENVEQPTIPGCNPLLGPCEEGIPVRPATWGRMKRLFPGG
jgi:hypothetical protein